MKLITKALSRRLAQLGSQDDKSDPIVVTKFFNPAGVGTWYVIAYQPEDHTCFGYVTGLDYDELGYFSMTELENFRSKPLGVGIERDLSFSEKRLSEIKD